MGPAARVLTISAIAMAGVMLTKTLTESAGRPARFAAYDMAKVSGVRGADALMDARMEEDLDALLAPDSEDREEHNIIDGDAKDSNPELAKVAKEYSLPGGVVFKPSMMPELSTPGDISPKLRSLSKTDDAPTGAQALALARSWGLPDSWNARHHPTHFILGAPKAGTTYLERCYGIGSLAGDKEHQPFPRPSIRWPLKKFANGETEVVNTAFAFAGAWNRTGFRRWDTLKEPRIYRHCGNKTNARYYRQFESFPPVEPGSRNWEVMDATPTYIHGTTVTENVYADHMHDLKRPRFVVGWRSGMARAFSHYTMIQANNKWRLRKDAFMRRMRGELKMWDEPNCTVLHKDPESLMEAHNKPLLKYVMNKCFKHPNYLGLSLPAFGLRYWLHYFDASQFTVIRTEAMRKTDPTFLINVLAKAFNLKPKPKCSPGQNWKTDNCFGTDGWAMVTHSCIDKQAAGFKRPASYSNQASKLGLHKGTPEDQAPFLKIFERHDAMFLKLLKDFNVSFIAK